MLIFGNGGSAADAQHFACELVGRFLRERRALPAMALTADTTQVTAIANDYGFDRVFVRQIEAHGRPGDVAVGISTSGTSANVLPGLQYAKSRGLKTVAFTGGSGGSIGAAVDVHVNVPHELTPSRSGSAPHADPRGLRPHRAADGQPMAEIRTETMTVNMGPQHPSTHGVLRLVLELDGENIVSAAPTIGYLHTGIEKTAEQKKFQQVIPLVERMDYLSAQSNAYAYCLSVEKLLGLEMPDRVKWIRVLLAELQRINSHLVWLGTHAMEVGAISVMLYCFRERELLLDINERIAGFRMFPSYIRVGGLREDLPRGFHEVVTQFLESFPAKLGEYEGLLTKNDIYRKRTQGVGILSKEDCIGLSLTGPIGRASGWNYDVRKMFPYGGYETFEFDVPVGASGDVYERYRIRIAEMRESVKICREALSRISPAGVFAADAPTVVPPPKDRVYTEMEALIQHFLIYSQGFTVPVGDAYVPVEGPRGEQGFYVVSDGTNRPWRLKARSPSLLACQALPKMILGGLIADVIAVIGSIDVVMGDGRERTGRATDISSRRSITASFIDRSGRCRSTMGRCLRIRRRTVNASRRSQSGTRKIP